LAYSHLHHLLEGGGGGLQSALDGGSGAQAPQQRVALDLLTQRLAVGFEQGAGYRAEMTIPRHEGTETPDSAVQSVVQDRKGVI